jgi:hypothetical protein
MFSLLGKDGGGFLHTGGGARKSGSIPGLYCCCSGCEGVVIGTGGSVGMAAAAAAPVKSTSMSSAPWLVIARVYLSLQLNTAMVALVVRYLPAHAQGQRSAACSSCRRLRQGFRPLQLCRMLGAAAVRNRCPGLDCPGSRNHLRYRTSDGNNWQSETRCNSQFCLVACQQKHGLGHGHEPCVLPCVTALRYKPFIPTTHWLCVFQSMASIHLTCSGRNPMYLGVLHRTDGIRHEARVDVGDPPGRVLPMKWHHYRTVRPARVIPHPELLT